jgi:hypothetical protein
MKPIEDAKMIEVVKVILEERRAHELRNRALARSLELLHSQLAAVKESGASPPTFPPSA